MAVLFIFTTIWASEQKMCTIQMPYIKLLSCFHFPFTQGLSECTMKMGYETDLTEADDAVDVLSLTAFPKLCCKDGAPCKICLVLDVEINIRLDMEKDMEDEGHSGLEEEEEDYSEETRNPRGVNN